MSLLRVETQETVLETNTWLLAETHNNTYMAVRNSQPTALFFNGKGGCFHRNGIAYLDARAALVAAMAEWPDGRGGAAESAA